ncbi:hypothetical protein EUGRSUZ_D02605 [Eucalyptus grandis]|uniref:Uncharacterized protein n=1 Tax=Eucalyptus grandis TaxID=71139 RepID=A0A059CJY4_EUCGR|nr:hypothetical protein EUGRSUZ_D02605 [Eucalyptus grandis]
MRNKTLLGKIYPFELSYYEGMLSHTRHYLEGKTINLLHLNQKVFHLIHSKKRKKANQEWTLISITSAPLQL